MKHVSLKIVAFFLVVFIFPFGKSLKVSAEETESFAKQGCRLYTVRIDVWDGGGKRLAKFEFKAGTELHRERF